MVKITREELECDVCRATAERYAVTYPDGVKVLDRCEKHAKKLLGLKDEPGEWSALTSRKGKLTILSPEEIHLRRQRGNNNNSE